MLILGCLLYSLRCVPSANVCQIFSRLARQCDISTHIVPTDAKPITAPQGAVAAKTRAEEVLHRIWIAVRNGPASEHSPTTLLLARIHTNELVEPVVQRVRV